MVPQTVVPTTKTIVLIIEISVSMKEKMVSATSTTVSGFEKMVSGIPTTVSAFENVVSRLEKIFWTTKTMVEIDRCCKFRCSNNLIIVSDHGL